MPEPGTLIIAALWTAGLGAVFLLAAGVTALAAACRAYREAHGLPEGVLLADDALRFHVRDEEIVIEFATEARQP